MLRTIEMYTNEYKDTTQKEIRKKKGQFFTEYSYAAEPPVQFRLSHLSRRSEPL